MLFKTCGVCSSAIEFDVKDNKITNVHFIGGCSGNTQGVARLIEGMDVVNKIAETDTDYSDRPLDEQKIKSMTVDTFGVDYPEPEKC